MVLRKYWPAGTLDPAAAGEVPSLQACNPSAPNTLILGAGVILSILLTASAAASLPCSLTSCTGDGINMQPLFQGYDKPQPLKRHLTAEHERSGSIPSPPAPAAPSSANASAMNSTMEAATLSTAMNLSFSSNSPPPPQIPAASLSAPSASPSSSPASPNISTANSTLIPTSIPRAQGLLQGVSNPFRLQSPRPSSSTGGTFGRNPIPNLLPNINGLANQTGPGRNGGAGESGLAQLLQQIKSGTVNWATARIGSVKQCDALAGEAQHLCRDFYTAPNGAARMLAAGRWSATDPASCE
jgi:hypothetical protein